MLYAGDFPTQTPINRPPTTVHPCGGFALVIAAPVHVAERNCEIGALTASPSPRAYVMTYNIPPIDSACSIVDVFDASLCTTTRTPGRPQICCVLELTIVLPLADACAAKIRSNIAGLPPAPKPKTENVERPSSQCISGGGTTAPGNGCQPAGGVNGSASNPAKSIRDFTSGSRSRNKNDVRSGD